MIYKVTDLLYVSSSRRIKIAFMYIYNPLYSCQNVIIKIQHNIMLGGEVIES